MKITHLIVATTLACCVGAGTAYAQATTTAPAAPAAPAKPAAPAAKPAAPSATGDADDKSAISAKCSAEATKRGLRGKERKVFRSKCKRGKT